MKKLLLMLALLFGVGVVAMSCSDAQRGKILSYGNSAKVTCYSGGVRIYDGFSTGKVQSEQDSDGYYFVDKRTKETMEVSGNCIIIYK